MCSSYEVGCVADRANYGMQCIPDLIQPLNMEKQTSLLKSPGNLWRAIGASVVMPSNVSCIKISRRYDAQATDADSSVSHSLYPSDVHFFRFTRLFVTNHVFWS